MGHPKMLADSGWRFRLGSLLLVIVGLSLLFALTVAARRQGDRSGGCARCYAAVFSWAWAMRWPGAWLGARLGSVAKHAVAWFAAIASAWAIFFFLNAERLELDEGLIASTLVAGVVVGTMVEGFMMVLERARRARPDDELA